MSESMIIGIIGAGAAYTVIGIVWWILQIVANWKIFTKAGEAGWKSIIPFYSGHISYKIAWKPMYFWIGMIASSVASGMNEYYQQTGGTGLILFIALVLMIVSAVLNIMYCNKLSKAFGKSLGFTIGLIILNPIFILILGLGKAEYVGNQS